ncbi:MAG: putative endonuclease 4 [Phycisphaeraceae bacterium]|nr:MAG: putative endonuclease 4 [Phycisphaeraceae bacterium]
MATKTSPLFGSHLSIAGGMTNALTAGEALGLDTVQVFTKNQQQWKVKPLDPAAVADWRSEIDRLGWQGRTVSHASYLINLASPNDELWEKSIALMVVELERCEELGIAFLVHHPGAYTTSDADTGLTRIARAYKEIFKRTKGFATVSCLEDTVGSGSNLGRTFDELGDLRRRIIDQTGDSERVGFCIDTCHAHAGGYDLGTRAMADAAIDELDAACGLANVRVLHVNDSLKEMGSRKDRHAHIGEGTIGKPPGPSGKPKKVALKDSGFAAFMNRSEFAGIPAIMETPKGDDDKGKPYDAMNLRRLKSMLD